MKITIKRHGNRTAVLISFGIHSDRFESNYERNKFFHGLYGWKQIINNSSGNYRYNREGLLSGMPHIKVDNSVFIVAMKEMQRISKYFEEWHEKVTWKTFRIMLEPKEFKELMENKKRAEDKIKEF